MTSKRVKIKRTEGTPIDMSNFYANQKKILKSAYAI